MAYPNGWLIHMKQYPLRSFDQFEQYEKYYKRIKSASTHYTAFGNFDRIEFIPISNFSDYQLKAADDKNWIGKQHTVILYVLEKEGNNHFFEMLHDGDKEVLAGRQADGTLMPLCCRFIIHTVLYISCATKLMFEDYQLFLDKIKGKIYDAVDKYRESKKNQDFFRCEVFGTFNSAEIAIVWAADEYVDVLYLVDQLRHLRMIIPEDDGQKTKEVFVSTYTVISANPKAQYNVTKNAKGTAIVQLECSNLIVGSETLLTNDNSVQQYIKNVFIAAGVPEEELKIFACAGEYDYTVQVPFSVIPKIFPFCSHSEFDNSNTLSIHNEEFALHIRQTTTRLLYNDRDIDERSKSINWNAILTIQLGKDEIKELDDSFVDLIKKIDRGTVNNIGTTYKLYNQIYVKLRQLFPNSILQKSLKLLYRDYVDILCTATDHLWTKDYDEQFVTVLLILQSLLDSFEERQRQIDLNDKYIRDFNDYFNTLFGILQQQANHIAESSKLFFEAPNSNMGYTAQFDLILHAYYGIVKSLIKQAYQTQRNSWQYTIVPVINFTNTTIIKSEMLRTVDEDRLSRRLVSLSLPYDAWAHPLYYTPFLFHEIYHYIAPKDRKLRNEAFLRIVLHQVSMQILSRCLLSYVKSLGEIMDKNSDEARAELAIYSGGCKIFEYYLFDAILEKQEEFFKKWNIENITAYELRDFIKSWFVDPDLNENKIDWSETIRTIIRISSEKLIANPPAYDEPSLSKSIELSTNFAEYWTSQSRRVETSPSDNLDDKNAAMEILSNLREIYPDIAMIRGTKMKLIDYLVQFAMLQNNLMNTPKIVFKERAIALRLGAIIDLFLTQEGKELQEYEKAFVSYYHSFMFITSSDYYETNQDSNDIIAQKWFGLFCEVYKYYKHNYSIYRNELSIYIREQCLFVIDDPKIGNIYEKYWALLKNDSQKESLFDESFSINIQLIHLFQQQSSLVKIREIGDYKRQKKTSISVDQSKYIEAQEKFSTNIVNDNSTFYLRDSDDLFVQLRKMVDQLKQNHEQLFPEKCEPSNIWYRGVNNSEYHIIPSLFVHYSKKYIIENNHLVRSPYQVLEHRFQQFKFRADGAPEQYNQAGFQLSDYLSLMQHYSIPTNLLDWSEDVFASLYFALENEIKGTKDNPNEQEPIDAVIYLLDPAAYNAARQSIIEDCMGKAVITQCDGNGCDKCKNTSNNEFKTACLRYRNRFVRRSLYETGDIVPNISVEMNRRIFDALICGHHYSKIVDNEYFDASNFAEDAILDSAPSCFSLPIAVYTARLNPRIRAQSGQFVIFDPHTLPRISDKGNLKGCFDYISLDIIQENWLKRDPLRKPFLLRLIIKSSVKKELANQLKYLGIRRGKYYPELAEKSHDVLDD